MNGSDLHILVIPTWYPGGSDQLLGIYHKHFSQALAENGVKVNMLFVDSQPISTLPRYPFMTKYYELPEKGYTTYCLRMLNMSRISYDLQMKLYAKKMEKLFLKYVAINGKPDVLHAQVTVPAGYAACVVGKKYGIPVIVTEHHGDFDYFFHGKEEEYIRFVGKHAAKITYVSSYMGDIFRKELGVQGQVLPNVVDCSRFSAPKAVDPNGPLQLVSVCALRIGKQIHIAAEALKILRESGRLPTSFRYTVVGDGEMADTFKKWVAEMGMSDCVDFVGTKTQAEIAQILSRSHMLLIPSRRESFGIPAIEALAAGVPVISTRCNGPETFLTPACSELCEVNDPQGMADAIERMYHRLPELKESDLRDVARQFDNASIAKLAQEYYREVMAK